MNVTACKVCNNLRYNTLYTVREMQFGTREEFVYQLCAECGCMQLQNIPADLSKYYPQSNYYSFHREIVLEKPQWKKKAQALHYIRNRKSLKSLLSAINFEPPAFFEWFRNAGVDFTDSILDVGTGNGSLLAEIYPYGFTNLTGVDPFIEQDLDYGPIKVFKKSIFQLHEQFDYIMSHHSFEHMDEPHAVFLQLNQLLRSGKYLLVRMPVMGNYGWKTFGVNWVALDAPRHIIIHSEKSLSILAQKAGFEVRKVVYDDVEAFSIWASEQYVKDIPLHDKERSYAHNPKGSIFSKVQIKEFNKLSEELKKKGQGDQAAFYLYKP